MIIVRGGINLKKILGIFKNYMGLPRSIYVLFFASIANSLGNFVMPLLTMFLTYNLGINVAVVGTIVAVNSGLGMVGAMIGGKLIDSVGRKSTFAIYRTISAGSIISCAFIKNPTLIIVLLMAATFFGGFSQPVYSTMITDLTEGNERKVAFSLEYMAINIGYSFGPLFAGFLYKNYIKLLFIGDGITTLISIFMVGLFVPETLKIEEKSKNNTQNSLEKAEEGNLLSAMIKRPALIMFSFIMVIYFIVFSQFNFGLSLQIGESFKDNMSWVFGSLMTVNAVMCSVFTVFVVSLTKDTDPAFTIAAGGILYAIGFGMMFFINGYFMFVLSTIIWSTGEILVANNTNTYISAHTPSSHRGRFNSIFPMIRRLGFICGPIIAGVCVKNAGIRNLWLIIGALALIGSAMMYRLYYVYREAKMPTVQEIEI